MKPCGVKGSRTQACGAKEQKMKKKASKKKVAMPMKKASKKMSKGAFGKAMSK